MFNRTRYRAEYDAGFSDGQNPIGHYEPADRKGEALEAYETGYEDGQEEASESYANSCDPSMRDTHGVGAF